MLQKTVLRLHQALQIVAPHTGVHYMFASIFKAAKSTTFKFQLIIHSSAWIGDEIASRHFDSKIEAKAFAKQLGAKPYNY
jgi:hypothetical protein